MQQSFTRRFLPIAIILILLMSLGAAEAQTILTVGPHGTYANIQDAIDAAVVGDQTEIRVEGGNTYFENLEIDASFSSGIIELLGGWNMGFNSRIFLPQDTVIDSNGDGRVLDAFGHAGSLVVDGFTCTNGHILSSGAGIRIDPAGDSQVTLNNIRIVDNTATTASGASGGGLQVELYANQRLELTNCKIKDNTLSSTGGGVIVGGGVNIRAIGDSSFLIQGCEIYNNTMESAGQLFGAGVRLTLMNNAQGELLDTSIVENTADGADVWVSGSHFEMRDFSMLNVERTAIGVNTTIGAGFGWQLWTSQGGTSSFRMSDSFIGLGDHGGMQINADHTSTANLVNLTVPDNPEIGAEIRQFGSATMTLYNTISYGNSTDLSTSGAVDTGSNLIGVDPLFVNPAGPDYHLLIGSPAENTGHNSPPGGLGLFDLDGNPRIKDGTVDIGCYEGIAEVFMDDFETGDTSQWSAAVPFRYR